MTQYNTFTSIATFQQILQIWIQSPNTKLNIIICQHLVQGRLLPQQSSFCRRYHFKADGIASGSGTTTHETQFYRCHHFKKRTASHLDQGRQLMKHTSTGAITSKRTASYL